MQLHSQIHSNQAVRPTLQHLILLSRTSRSRARLLRASTAPSAAAGPVAAAAADPVTLGAVTFPNKEAARDSIRQLLGTTHVGSMITPDTPDGQLLLSLVQRHARAAEKIGCGVSHFTTARTLRADNVSTKHFVLHRLDGSSTDFRCVGCHSTGVVTAPCAVWCDRVCWCSDRQDKATESS
jgi:hypothetical protein